MKKEKPENKKHDLQHNSICCIHCRGSLRINDDETGEIICGSCGYVISERNASLEPETGSFSDEVNKQRTGNSFTLARHDMGLSTIINPVNRDATGNMLSSEMKSAVKRLRLWDKRAGKNTDKNYQHAFHELERIRDKIGVSDTVMEKSAYLYRKIVERRLTRGRNITTFVAASLYTACRITETPRTVKDIQKASGVSRRDLTKYYRLMLKEFDLQIPMLDPTQCVVRIANNVGISEKTKRFAIDLLYKAKQHGVLEGKDPTSTAATAIYIACKKMKETFSQRKIAMAANVTEITIRNRTKGLLMIMEKS